MVQSSPILELLRFILRPVVRFCLRHSLHIQDLLECAKGVFIEEADREISKSAAKSNVSRLAVVTGLHRRDVMRLLKGETKTEAPQGLTNRIIGQWQYDKHFCSKPGKPRALSCEGEESEFRTLVESVSSDLNPGTILFELERIGVVKRKGRRVSLITQVYVPAKRSIKEGFSILSQDGDDLIRAVEENVLGKGEPKNLHGRTEFDNVDPEQLPGIRRWLMREGATFHKKARDHISQFDRDITGKKGKGGARVSVSTFGVTEE